MLAFLDSLCAALIARDADRIRALLGHPLARALPRDVREEALAMAQGERGSFQAPLHALRLYHQTAHLLGAVADPATRRGANDPEAGQIELPLEAASTS